jgi:hypothetical protein
VGAHARARAGGPAGPPAGDGAVGAGPCASEEGENDVRGDDGGEAVCGRENRPLVKFRSGSSQVARFCIDGMVVRHEQR